MAPARCPAAGTSLILAFAACSLLALTCTALDERLQQALDQISDKARLAAETVDPAGEEIVPGLDQQTQDVLDSYTALARGAVFSPEPKETWIYRCRYVQAATIRRVLENFVTSNGTVADAEESDVVIVSDVQSNMEQLRAITSEVDQHTPQVLVVARIVELTVDSDFEKEVELAFESLDVNRAFVDNMRSVLRTPGANPNTEEGSIFNFRPWITDDDLLTAFLRFLETRGRANILSKPNLILSRGTEGSIVTGEEVPILTQTVTSGSVSTSTEFKSVGIKLQVTPLMITGDTVRVRISPEVSTVTGFSSAGEGVSNPIIAIRQAHTELRVKDGELVSIGGLLRSEKREVERRVPLLSTLPVIGSAFVSTRRESVQTQLVIFLTIHVLEEGEVNGTRIVRPIDRDPRVQEEVDRMSDERDEPTLKKDIRSWFRGLTP